MFLSRRLLQITSIIVVLTILFSSFPMRSASARGKDSLKRQVNAQMGEVSFFGPENGRTFFASPNGDSDAIQNSDPTPFHTEMSLPTKTTDLALTLVPMSEETELKEGTSNLDVSISEVNSLAGVTWYVATSGNDSNSCSTPASPCKTINGAIGKATNGDAIKVAIGVYTGSGTEIVNISKGITLSGGWDATFSNQLGYSTIDGQKSRQGIFISVDNVSIARFVVQNCIGSGIYIAYWGGATIYKSIITNNLAATHGGGIFNEGLLILNNSSVHNNVANYDGGGIYNLKSLTINNTTVSHNSAYWGGGVDGGGVEANVTLNNVTISDNIASFQGGGISKSRGNISVKNTIIANNTAVTGFDCLGTIASAGYNIIENTGSCTITSAIGDQFNIDPQLGELNPVLGVHPLLPTSPAVDAGNPAAPGSQADACLTIDQREAERPLDGPDPDLDARCDIGAYEYTVPGNVAYLLYFSGSPQVVTPNTQLPNPMKVIAVDTRGTPVPNAPVNFSAPTEGPSGTFFGSDTNVVTVFTDLSGIAIAPIFNANNIMGRYNVVATNVDVSTTVSFSITNGYWIVATNGNDLNDCMSIAFPCATIQGAFNKPYFSDGQTIRVGIGVFGTPNIISVSKNITISGGWNSTFISQIGTSTIEDPIGTYPGTNVTLERVTVQKTINSAGVSNSSILTIKNSSIIDNYKGIANYGTLTIINSTISGNGSIDNKPSYGGGLENGNTTGTAHVTIVNSTITKNMAYSGGGIYNSSTAAGTIILKNSIIAGNIADLGTGPDCNGGYMTNFGDIISLGHNLVGTIGSYNGAMYPCEVDWLSTDIVGINDNFIDAKLDLLTDLGNGLWVHPLKLVSPAIDAGDDASCPSTDQRGRVRPYGSHCDIGAYEVEYILISGNAGVAGVTLSYIEEGTPQTFRADSKGNYFVRLPLGWSGTVIPSKIGYIFTPANRTYSNLQSHQTGQNYTAQYVGGADTTGVFRPTNGALYLKNTNATGFADVQINYGLAGDYPLVGDWDGDGDATIGIYRNGSFYLRNSNTIGFADLVFPFGSPGDQPIAGDWDGDGIDTIGVYRSSIGTFFLRNNNSPGAPEMSFALGNPGDVGIAGDWDGDGVDTTGVFRPSNGALYLKNTNATGFADIQINYGLPGDKPLTGDWNNDGVDTIGIYRNGTFYLRNSNTIGYADLVFALGINGDMPIAGNWDGLP